MRDIAERAGLSELRTRRPRPPRAGEAREETGLAVALDAEGEALGLPVLQQLAHALDTELSVQDTELSVQVTPRSQVA